ncbi:MAG: hypothetical protein ACLR4Z_13495 [Butyricicoccaceae bacterium]
MQWDKVKNVLIGILLAVNLFLLGNLGFRLWQNYSRASGLDADLRALVSGYGSTLADSFRLPEDVFLPELNLDRSRADEENAASVMLGAEMERTELEDGTVRFQSGDGTVTWYADGRVNGVCPIPGETPDDETAAIRAARKCFAEWGLAGDGASYQVSGLSVMQTAPVANRPVHNRELTLTFNADGTVTLSGTWSFGTLLHDRHGTRRGLPRSGRSASVRLLARKRGDHPLDDGGLPDADGQQPPASADPDMEDRDRQNGLLHGLRQENARYPLKRRPCGRAASGFGGEHGNSSAKTGCNLLISPKKRDMDGKAEKKLSFIQNCDTMYE